VSHDIVPQQGASLSDSVKEKVSATDTITLDSAVAEISLDYAIADGELKGRFSTDASREGQTESSAWLRSVWNGQTPSRPCQPPANRDLTFAFDLNISGLQGASGGGWSWFVRVSQPH
jgi:hypothetical protein